MWYGCARRADMVTQSGKDYADLEGLVYKMAETAQALDTFITYAGELKNVITEHGVNVNKTCQKFKAEIDENDQYLF